MTAHHLNHASEPTPSDDQSDDETEPSTISVSESSGARRVHRTASACAAAVFVAVTRWAISSGRDEYALWPDEPAQLAMARFLGGGTRWYMHNHSIWRPGFATLLSPIHWFTDDPVTVLHAGFAVNAVLGGASAALMVMVARRLTSMSPAACAAAAILVSCAPAVLFTTDFLWSESLVTLLFLATLLALMRLQRAPSLPHALGAGALAVAAFATHSRMLPLTAITVGMIVLSARNRISRGRAAAAVLAAAAGVVGVVVGSRAIVSRLWNQSSNINSADAVANRATDIGPVMLSLAGQSWYLLVSSVGIAGFGAAALVRSASRPTESPVGCFRRDALDGNTRHDGNTRLPGSGTSERRDAARIVLVVVGACVALSIVFMAGRQRTDQVVYGRYNDAVMAPVLLAGIWSLLAEVNRRRHVIAAIVISAVVFVTTAILLAWRRGPLDADDGIEPMILGLQPFIRSDTTVRVVQIAITATVISGFVVLVAVWSAGRRMIVLTVVLAALVLAGTMAARTVINREWHDRGDFSVVQAVRGGVLTDGEPVDYFLSRGSNSTNRLMLYEMYLPHTEFTVIDDVLDQASSSLVFAPSDDSQLRAAGATLVWRDPRRPFGLWDRSTGN